MSGAKRVLVTGATGQQGGAVARSLLDRGVAVRAMTRNVESAAAKELEAKGAELVTAEFSDPASLSAALEGVDAVFAMTTPFEAGVEAEAAQGRALVDAAKEAGVGHFLYSSVASADQATGIPHFDSKFEVEEHLAASGISWTVIGPVYFMDNLFLPMMLDELREGRYSIAMPADVPLQQVATADIGAFAAHVLTHPEVFTGLRIDLAGDMLSSEATAAALSESLGRTVEFNEVPIDVIRSFSEDLALMYEWFVDTGYSVDVPALRSAYPEIEWTDFGTWLSGAAEALA